MALVEVVLTYRPHGVGDDLPAVPLGRSDDPRLLRAVRDRLIEAANEDARFWHSIDPGVAAMKDAEADRLERVLAFIVPDSTLRPELQLVGGTDDDERPHPDGSRRTP